VISLGFVLRMLFRKNDTNVFSFLTNPKKQSPTGLNLIGTSSINTNGYAKAAAVDLTAHSMQRHRISMIVNKFTFHKRTYPPTHN